MTHLEQGGSEHRPPSKEDVHHGGLQDSLSEGGQPGTPTVFVGGVRAGFEVERLVGVDLEDEVAFDGWNRRRIVHTDARDCTLSGNRVASGRG